MFDREGSARFWLRPPTPLRARVRLKDAESPANALLAPHARTPLPQSVSIKAAGEFNKVNFCVASHSTGQTLEFLGPAELNDDSVYLSCPPDRRVLQFWTLPTLSDSFH